MRIVNGTRRKARVLVRQSIKIFAASACGLILLFTPAVFPVQAADQFVVAEESATTPDKVDKLINSLGTNPDKAKVTAARQAYDSLSMADQLKVKNYDTLVKAEKQIEAKEPVQFTEGDTGTKTDSHTSSAKTSNLIRLAVAAGAVVTFFAVINHLPVKGSGGRKNDSEKADKKKEKTDTDTEESISEEEEIARIKKEFEDMKKSGLYDDPAPEKKKEEKPKDTDRRLTETVEDLDDGAEDVSDFDDDFFTHSHF